MSRDICTFQSPRHRVFQNNEWQLVDTPFEGRTDPPLWLAELGVRNMINYIIPAQSATRQFQVRGGVSPSWGDWVVKCQCVRGKARGTTLTPTLMSDGFFIMELDGPTYLKAGEVTLVYFKGCSHTPPGDGLSPVANDALSLTVG